MQADLEALLDPKGDPMSLVRWTTKSVAKLKEALKQQGHQLGDTAIRKRLHALGFRLAGTLSMVSGIIPSSLKNLLVMVMLFKWESLCDETMHIWAEQLGPIYSNIPLNPAWRLSEGQQGHCAIDFGADEYTRGRPHPMIDPSLRLKRFQEEANDPSVRAILLDIVLGDSGTLLVKALQ